jgi:hypothetical protein
MNSAAEPVKDRLKIRGAGQNSARYILYSVLLGLMKGSQGRGPVVQNAAEPDQVDHFVGENVNQKRIEIPFSEEVFSLSGGQNASVVELDAIKVKRPDRVDSLQAAHPQA